MTLDGELVASSTGHALGYAPGERVFHQKFGYGLVAEVDGNKLTIDFDKAGRKRVVDSFVARARDADDHGCRSLRSSRAGLDKADGKALETQRTLSAGDIRVCLGPRCARKAGPGRGEAW